MPCITEAPDCSREDSLEYMLCQACRYLTREQINSIDGLSIWIGLEKFYSLHLMSDLRKNKDNKEESKKYIEEAARVGWDLRIDENDIIYIKESKECNRMSIFDRIQYDMINLKKYVEDEIKSVIQTLSAQSVGLQNVYDEFKKVSHPDLLDKLNQLASKDPCDKLMDMLEFIKSVEVQNKIREVERAHEKARQLATILDGSDIKPIEDYYE